MSESRPRAGAIELAVDPAQVPGEAHLVFIGHVRSPWTRDAPRPKNPREARERGGFARLEISAPFRPGLMGIEAYSHIIVLAWLHEARRTPIVIHPPQAASACGVFALRSPVRPNPIGLTVARLVHVDAAAGVLELDAIDFLDGTPIVDIKPYRPGIDAVQDAVVA